VEEEEEEEEQDISSTARLNDNGKQGTSQDRGLLGRPAGDGKLRVLKYTAHPAGLPY
jgi:hypothetical protein